MERTIFPLVGTLSIKGILIDVWPSGMTRVVFPHNEDYIELLSMASNPPGSKTDEELWSAWEKDNSDYFFESLDQYEWERLDSIMDSKMEEVTDES